MPTVAKPKPSIIDTMVLKAEAPPMPMKLAKVRK